MEQLGSKLPLPNIEAKQPFQYSPIKADEEIPGPIGNQSSQHGARYHDRVILTTYPGQVGIKPLPLNWGEMDPHKRGPVLASRNATSMKRRNSIGAYSGSYCIYHALAVAIGDLPANHKPDYTNTEPPFQIGPHDSWKKIVSLDPFGHMVQQLFASEMSAGLHIRPTIAATKAHMRVPEIETIVRDGTLKTDGTVVLNAQGELVVSKAAVEPVWYLPGVAQRFKVTETELRRALL